ncbi:MAG: alcohol dehydrogenase catalytic domain-containing protein, partial [Actinomycetota bacterium]|nr:alcohol dehydrogenase catalytic domain-containing protein [Actinomycetota bacterium]
MRAAVCHRVGDDAGVEVGDLPDPAAGPGQVEIAVAAAGVNFPDLLMVRGQYQFRPEPPFAPGLEVAGTVTASADGGYAPGSPVMAYLSHGGWAERVVVDASQVFPVPAAMPFEVAAVLPIGYGTAIHALVDRARIRPREKLVVLGAAGGVGLAAVQLGRILGARVIGVVGADDKAAAATA